MITLQRYKDCNMYAKNNGYNLATIYFHPLMLGYFADNHYLCNINKVIIIIMKNITTIIVSLLMGAVLPANAQESVRKDFVKGADVGFLTGQEQRGQKFYDVDVGY